ncbi:MAG: transcriptional regulator [Caulobacteraceae bacterium]|jgi:putative transcriptional regulator|nr:transcriptional regulator [Caulobacteraceae bacterium]
MAKAKFGHSDVDTEFGASLIEGLEEVAAWKRGEIALPVLRVDPMPASRVRQIRKAVAKSPREFERRFHIPARTLEGWEQGRTVDATARVLLTVIEKNPEAVERALAENVQT